MTPLKYLEAARRRLRLRYALRAAAATLTGLLAATALSAWLIMLFVPAAAVVTGGRILLYVIVGLVIVLLARWRYTPARAARIVEARVPAFAGRLVTWLDADARHDRSDLFALLGRQTSDIADRHPMTRVIPVRQLAWPALGAVAAVALLAALLAGGHPWQLAAQRLWAGSLASQAQPRIVVTPGDAVVRRGSDVVVEARAMGFRPDRMSVHAAFGAGGWEEAPMAALSDDGFSFVFVGVGQEVAYYVSARGLASTRHRIRVADLPRVTDLSLTYRYPDWTGLEPLVRSDGDVSALPGSRVEVAAATDRNAEAAVLVINGREQPLTADGRTLRGGFEVNQPGSWHVAVPHQGELARISDSYLIELSEDAPPEVSFEFPGRDRKATPIEEVALTFAARDDYGVEALSFSYAVNGGRWNRLDLSGGSGDHVLRLENLSVSEPGAERPLRPGDVISLYGEAHDHASSARTSLYFVDVRPFDLRYRESQQVNAQGPSEGGGFDIAERQRDILSATWNLINKRGDMAPQAVQDEADVLAMLQRTLKDQAGTLLARSRARGLGTDGDMSAFLQAIEAAIGYMEPAALNLEKLALDDAVPPEQQALGHLMTAEASVRDVNVSMSRNDTRGTAGRSLGELIELEMDPERNRYEVPQQAGLGERADAGDDEDWRRLQDLAARQERLARQSRQNPDSLPSRWEQARLQRELEAMRQRLEARGRQSNGSPSGAADRALSDVRAAQRALERTGEDAGARQRAGEALQRAADRLREQARDDLQERLGRVARRAANLESDQARVMEALDAMQASALDRARNGERTVRSDFAMQTFGAVKRRMQNDLADLRGELTELGDSLEERGADGARALDRALDELDQSRVDERLAASAEAFEMGQPLYVIGSEALVTQALERLRQRIDQARDSMVRGGADAAGPLETVRALRRRLTDARSADGSLAGAEVETVARSLSRLEREADPRQDGAGAAGPAPTGFGRGRYTIRGVAAENTEALYRMTLERLDLVEAALERAEIAPVRAQRPRDAGRDSAAAARYFRDLSRTVGDNEQEEEPR